MLRGCTFPDCETLTLSAYCLEHELFIRAELEADGARGSDHQEVTGREAGAQGAA
jgi:hypothetical protein